MKRETILRIVLYIAGMILLAAGITLNTKVTLGVSPIISVAYAFSRIYDINFGDATMVWYCIFVAVEVVLHLLFGGREKKKKVTADLLQIIVTAVFSRLLNLMGALIPEFETDCPGTFSAGIPGRILWLLLAIVLTGVGAAMSLNMRIVPNPGDGIVQTIADVTGKKTGTVKNFFDLTCVLLTICISLLLSGKIIGIGIGTVLSALLVGRVIALFNRLFPGSRELGKE